MHLHLHLHKRALIAIIVSVIVLGAFGGGIYWYVEERPLQNVSITVDFDQLQTYTAYQSSRPSGYPVNASIQPRTVFPEYNTLNVWDINFFNDPTNNATLYAQKYYPITHLNVMTTTGGRDTFSNEYLNISSTGIVTYNFTKLDRMVDWLEAANMTPTFVIGNTPYNLTSTPGNINYGAFGADISEPNNYTIYYNYIYALVSHVLSVRGFLCEYMDLESLYRT